MPEDAPLSAPAPAFPAVLPDDPLALLSRWFDDAVAAGALEPEAMALATAGADGAPSVRYVLFRGLGEGGLRFFTNLESRKADELAANPRAAVAFWWQPLGRQVRVEGRIQRLGPAEDDAYFAARPRGHRLAALASPQSRPIEPDQLLQRYAALEREYEGKDIPRPAGWGGFRLIPTAIEFWLRKDNRLHERLVYQREAPGGLWQRRTLGP
jgi:pyridoxamine 5'-phosphate oxidase